MSFFNIVFGVCKGTEIFLQLFRLSIWKALWHLLLLAVLCTVFVTTIKSFPLFKDINNACETITEQFGAIKITGKGIFPSIAPEKGRVVQLTDVANIIYIPELKGATLPDFDRDNNSRGIFWTPTLITGWYKTEVSDYLLYPLIYNHRKTGISTKPFQKDNILPYLNDNSSDKNPLKIPDSSENIEDYKFLIKGCAAFITFGVFLIQILFQPLILTSIFALIFNMVGNRNLKILQLKDVFVTAIYAGFPAIIIASFFPAFDLPMDFSTVYIFCFAVYFIYIMSRLERDLSGEKPEGATDDDDFL